MTRQELQTALKEFRNQSLTEIALNSKTDLLQAEYDRIVEENCVKQETTATTDKKESNSMVKYLVTTRLEVLEAVSSGCQVFMVDGTVPGWKASDSHFHFDHHRINGEDIQIDEMPPSKDLAINPDLQGLIVTTQVDADACVAAAYLQLKNVSQENLQKLRAIAYDCDHLGVPPELSQYADFAAQCVAAMKSDSDVLISELGLPNRKEWTIEQKEAYASLAFQRGTESLIAACKAERKFPGECGEAKEYWEKVENNTSLLLDTQRVYFYRDTVIIDYKGLQGQYIDPRCALKAYEWIKENHGHDCATPITLAQREVFVDNEFKGFSYTIGCIPLHSKLANLDYTQGTFEALTEAERKINPDADGWGGRKTVGGSGWNTPSQLKPEQVIDIVLLSILF